TAGRWPEWRGQTRRASPGWDDLRVESDDALDALRAAQDQVRCLLWGITAGDERSYHGRPAPPEGIEISQRGGEGLGPGVDRAQQHLVLEHHLPHEESRICLDEGLQARHAG